MDSGLPKLVFVLLALYAAAHFSYAYPQLPGVVASHFNGCGVPSGWQTKSALFRIFVGVSVLAAAIGFVIPRIVGAAPTNLIHLPNKEYWLAPKHRANTTQLLNAYFAWFGCAVFLIIIFTFDYARAICIPNARLIRRACGTCSQAFSSSRSYRPFECSQNSSIHRRET